MKQTKMTTIHAFKGLEWDFVYLPKMTAYSFPTSNALCKTCRFNFGSNESEKYCKFKFVAPLEERFTEELNVFYVGLTRAKEDIVLTASSEKNDYGYRKKSSCFLMLPNLR